MIKNFSSFIKSTNESTTGIGTSWEGDDGKITLVEINKYLEDNKTKMSIIDTNLIKDLLIDVKRDKKRVDNANLDFPIVITMLNGEYNRIIDGQHRLVKSIKIGEPYIKAYVLDLDTAPKKYLNMFK